MKNKFDPTIIALWANRFVALIVLVLLFTMPAIMDWYCSVRILPQLEKTAVTVTFYCCSAFIAAALWSLDALLRSIIKEQVFIRGNVRHIRVIQWCCTIISLLCLPASLIYYPLIFLVAIMSFLALVVCVLCRVMNAAVTLREENDLTI